MTSVTLCIPAWQSEATVGRAIESALAQTHCETRVLVSVDLGADGTADICARYNDDPRVEVVIHERRLGWAGNVNYCLDQIKTDTVAMVFHDEWVEPQFCEKLTALLDKHPQAIAASSAVAHYGEMGRTTFFEDAAGPLPERLMTFAIRPQSRYTLKALHRAEIFRDGLRLEDDGGQSFQVDVPFSLKVLLEGEFRATEDVLYHKQRDSSSVSAGWRQLEADDYLARQIEIRAQLVEIVTATSLSGAEKTAFTAAILSEVNRGLPPLGDTRIVASLHLRLASALAVRLAGGPISAGGLPEIVTQHQADQLRQRARHVRKAGHPALAAAETALAEALNSAEQGPDQATKAARELLKAPHTPERIAAALQAAERATALAPSNVPARVVLARALHASGETAQALSTAERAEAQKGEPIAALAAVFGRTG